MGLRPIRGLRTPARQVAIFGILAIGQLFVILTVGIDLSDGSVLGLAGAVTAQLLAAMWATLVKWLAEIRGEMFPPAGGLTRGSIHVDPGRLTGGLRACRWRRGSDCYARVGYRRTMCSDWSVSLV